MSRIFIRGIGAVSPAGWGVGALRTTVDKAEPLPRKELPRPGWTKPFQIRSVPLPAARPSFLAHPRMRRTSPVAQYAVAAAVEALGEDAVAVSDGSLRLAIVVCVMSGCVNYSRRFFDETLRDPGTASPLVFPETVFNAPASHLAALLGTTAINYTLVGDPGTFLQGVALAADWLTRGEAEGCLVLGAEEMDWLTADAFRLFTRSLVLSEGAGALYLRRESTGASGIALHCVTHSHLFFDRQTRLDAAARVRAELPVTAGELLCDSREDVPRLDAPELNAWRGWKGERL
ncbi:MAG TPA: beta-ketoacyl synthase N-terminal-like domain-containing protein, partial [Verrucomicrobiae bacterium]